MTFYRAVQWGNAPLIMSYPVPGYGLAQCVEVDREDNGVMYSVASATRLFHLWLPQIDQEEC